MRTAVETRKIVIGTLVVITGLPVALVLIAAVERLMERLRSIVYRCIMAIDGAGAAAGG